MHGGKVSAMQRLCQAEKCNTSDFFPSLGGVYRKVDLSIVILRVPKIHHRVMWRNSQRNKWRITELKLPYKLKFICKLASAALVLVLQTSMVNCLYPPIVKLLSPPAGWGWERQGIWTLCKYLVISVLWQAPGWSKTRTTSQIQALLAPLCSLFCCLLIVAIVLLWAAAWTLTPSAVNHLH